MHYAIRKAAPGRWDLFSRTLDAFDRIASYPSRSAAVTAARLLAGWRGSVTLLR